jgi:hypothetical protein
MNKNSRKRLQAVLNKNPSCYVLITCGQPSEDGQMQVEMTYQGDAALAAYLIQGAQFFIDQEEEQETYSVPENALKQISFVSHSD